jgi:hypothetical protein
MMKIVSFAVCLMVFLAFQLPATAGQSVTIAGKSVGLLKLGDTRKRVAELFPKNPRWDQETNFTKDESDCGYDYTEIIWHPLDFKGELFIYLKKDAVFEVMVQTKHFPTAEGITQYSSPKQVRQHYPNLKKAYVLLGSASKVNGPRNLVYWVDGESGIAFEFYYDSRKRQRLVSSVIIFQPNTEFHPYGCTGAPQELKEIGPYTLEPPRKMLLDFDRKWAK